MCPECSLHVGYTILLLQFLLHVCMAYMASACDPWSLRNGALTEMAQAPNIVAVAMTQLLVNTSPKPSPTSPSSTVLRGAACPYDH